MEPRRADLPRLDAGVEWCTCVLRFLDENLPNDPLMICDRQNFILSTAWIVEAVWMSRAPSEVKSTRIGPLSRLPAFFALEGKRAVVAGGSQAAAWKAELLSAAGARVEVFAPAPGEDMLALAAAPPRGAIVIHRAGLDGGRFLRLPPSPSPIAPTTEAPRNSPRPRVPPACRSMSSTVRHSAISPSAPSSIARRLSSAFPPMAPRRCSARRSAPRSKR